ncbi:MAG: dienelactone hydrolase family protein, partial [Phenylobacterium sp.]
YMDAPGKREELHDMARRIASVGYFVVLPTLYYRRVREYELAARDEASMKVMFEHMASLSNSLIASDTDALMAYVDAQPAARKDRVGAVGYCMSGPFVVTAAAHEPRLRCIASITAPTWSPIKPIRRIGCSTGSSARPTSPAPRSIAGRRPKRSPRSRKRCRRRVSGMRLDRPDRPAWQASLDFRGGEGHFPPALRLFRGVFGVPVA